MSEPAANQIKAKQICYIDDSKTSAYVTKKMLKQHGYTVDYFPDAESALESFMENQYDLLITDLLISSDGGVNGDDLIRIIRQSGHPEKANIPIVVVTGATDEQSIEDAKQAGANRVLQKPLNGNMLHTTIQALVRRQARTRSSTTNVSESQDVLTAKVFPYSRIPSTKPSDEHSQKKPDSVTEKLNASALTNSTKKQKSASEIEASIPKANIRSIESVASNIDQAETSILKSSTDEIPILTSTINSDQKGNEPSTTLVVDRAKSNIADKASILEDESRSSVDVIPDQIRSLEIQITDDSVSAFEKSVAEREQISKVEKNVRPEPKVVKATAPQSKAEPNPLMDLLDKLEDDDELRKDYPISGKKSGFKVPQWAIKAIWMSLVFVIAVPAFSFWYMGQKVVQVETLVPEKISIHSQISVPGRVVSKRKIDVSARDNGQLVEVSVKEGEKVKEGQILARIDDREADSIIKRVEARLLSIEEEVAAASKTQERLQRALDMGAVSRQRVEDAESTWKTASANQSVIEEELRAAKMQFDRLKIRAPFDGVITGVYVQDGQWLAQSDPILTIVDMEQRMVEIRVDASDSASLNVGQEVVLSSDAFPGKTWKETIIKIGSEAKKEDSANIIKVNASLSENALPLKMGQQVDAEIRTASRENATTLPYYVVFTHKNTPHVAVIENGKILFVPVSTGIEGVTHIEIIKGLREHQEVVIPPGDVSLEEGMFVTVINNVGNSSEI